MSVKPVLDRFNVRVGGHGSHALLFAHGFGCDQAMWRFVAPAFEASHRVVLFDYAGHGGGDPAAHDPERHSTLHGYVQDVLAVMDALQLERVTLVGHSVSATVALLAASQQPERFDRLVLVGPSPCYVNEPPHYYGGFERADIDGMLELMQKNYTGWAGALAPVIVANSEQPHFARELETSFCAVDPDIAHQFASVTFLSDHRDVVQHVTTPALILQCTDDAIAPEAVGRYLAERLPQSTFYHMRATGHTPHLTHPHETIAAIRAYLKTPVGQPITLGDP